MRCTTGGGGGPSGVRRDMPAVCLSAAASRTGSDVVELGGVVRAARPAQGVDDDVAAVAPVGGYAQRDAPRRVREHVRRAPGDGDRREVDETEAAERDPLAATVVRD